MSENEENETAAADSAEEGAVSDVATEVATDAATDAVAESDTSIGADEAEGTPITFGDLPEGAVVASGGATLELLYDLTLPITVELGRAALKVQDVLSLGEGSVVRLDRIAGDPVDVFVGSKKLAQAEVVVLEDRFGIRITHIYPDPGSSEA